MTSKEAFKNICKNLNSYEFTDEFRKGKNQIKKDLERLEQYENIEKELGIDLITIYDKLKSAKETLNKYELTPTTIHFTLFGKTWVLTREFTWEELE